jgi:SAM-dependent methyltransferase
VTDVSVPNHRRTASTDRWGSPEEFCQRYESFLDIAYSQDVDQPRAGGRDLLVRSIGNVMAERDVHRVLDCAAGTGFPALDLAADPPVKNFAIHCTDADTSMLEVLADRVDSHFGPEFELSVSRLAPKIHSPRPREGLGRFLLDWADLDQVQGTYDYVMCRGNSLVYASSWGGQKQVASKRLVTDLLRKMASKVRVGGYLHVDAPRNLGGACRKFAETYSLDGALSVWESIETEGSSRIWTVSFKSADETVKFQRLSTLMDIDFVSRTLSGLGFVETDPIELEHERPGFGVIIAKKARELA